MSTIVILYPQLDNESSVPKEVLLANEFGRKDEVQDLKEHLLECNSSNSIEIVHITLKNSLNVLAAIKEKYTCSNLVVLNLCDGTEHDGYPGLSVVVELERLEIPFTGAGSSFFEITTSKPVLKKLLIQHSVPTSKFVVVNPHNIKESVNQAGELLKWPLIVKPSVSYASISITTKSVVETKEACIEQIERVLKTTSDGVFLESFLAGREFTALCTGSASVGSGVKVYLVAERCFNSKLEDKERILAFDKYWEGYDLEGGEGTGEEPIYRYEAAPAEWQESLKKVAREAYIACDGSGYGRVDIRTRNPTDLDIYVLECNANCGLSFGKNSSSLGEILCLANVKPADFLKELIEFAQARKSL